MQPEAARGGGGVHHVHPLAAAPSRVRVSAARRADSGVPESPPEMCTDTTSPPSASSGSYTAVKSPTEGCDVVGRLFAPRSSSKKAS